MDIWGRRIGCGYRFLICGLTCCFSGCFLKCWDIKKYPSPHPLRTILGYLGLFSMIGVFVWFLGGFWAPKMCYELEMNLAAQNFTLSTEFKPLAIGETTKFECPHPGVSDFGIDVKCVAMDELAITFEGCPTSNQCQSIDVDFATQFPDYSATGDQSELPLSPLDTTTSFQCDG
eukprot:190570_1